MRNIFSATQTEGDPFKVGGGRYQLIVKDWAAEVKLQIEEPETDPIEWIDTNQSWSDNGVKVFWLSHEATYRVISGSAGATAYLQLISLRDV